MNIACRECTLDLECWEGREPLLCIKRDGTEDLMAGEAKAQLGDALFNTVKKTINHDRQDSYGKPEDSFSSIARRWTEYLRNRYGTGKSVTGRTVSEIDLTPKDVAFMMMELKMARESNKHKDDNIVDLVRYAALKMEMGKEQDKEYTPKAVAERAISHKGEQI